MDGLNFYNPLDEAETNVPASESTGDELQDVIENFQVEETPLTDEETQITEQEVPEEPTEEQVPNEEFVESVSGIANYLAENGLIKDVPKEIDLEQFSKEDFVTLIKHNVNTEGKTKFGEGVKYANQSLADKVGDGFAQKILSYKLDNPNADEADIQSFAGALMYSEDITNLTVENNAEKIVREYYKSIDWEPKNIEKKIIQLTELNDLEGEATILKPKLDIKASSIANEKLAHVQRIKEFEDGLQMDLQARVTSTLDTGKLNGVELSQEEAQFLYSATMNNDTAVTIKGKKVEMGFAEALIRNAKYNPKSNMEDFMLGLLIIQKGSAAIEKFYAKKATTKVVEEFTNNFKFSNNKKKVSNAPVESEMNTGLKFTTS